MVNSVFEIKVIFCTCRVQLPPKRCTLPFVNVSFYINGIYNSEKEIKGAGCILNFEHCKFRTLYLQRGSGSVNVICMCQKYSWNRGVSFQILIWLQTFFLGHPCKYFWGF